MDLTKKYQTLLFNNKLNSCLRICHFMAQIHHESDLKLVSENLNYSSERMLIVFKSDFDTNGDKWISPQEKEKVKELVGNPIKIANFVYANQNGNGNEQSGEGWKFRGRGFLQITGKNNYTALSKFTGINYVNNPDWLLREADAMIAAIWYWNTNNLNKFADKNDIKSITKIINGGYNGLEDRTRLFNEYYKKCT